VSPRVRFEPLGEEIECASEETVLDAAFRHGYNLVYGCREGQCSACKCFLIEGEAALKRYSSFALSDSEHRSGYSLMCRAMPESDLVVELLHYDPEDYRLAFPIRDGAATVELLEPLTHDISRLVLLVEEPSDFSFVPGQYVDLHVPGGNGARRSFSLANTPGDGRIELIIKRYPGGRISGMLDDAIRPGTPVGFTGPYGAFRARESERPILMIAAGSGMAPMLSVLRRLATDGCVRPVRFFYGARAQEDLFHLEEIDELGSRLPGFRFVTVLSARDGRYVQDGVDECLAAGEITDPDAYMCGPPAMVEATEAMLTGKHHVDGQHIYVEKFTASADAAPAERVAPPAAAPDESGRQFEWYRPHKRRATLYEDVTVDTQPSIHRHLTRGWPLHFEDGRGTWNTASTALKSADWFEFRDPGEQWERPFYQGGAAVELQIEGAIRSAIEEDLLADFSAEWAAFLRAFLQGPAFVEHGLWFAMATVARDCLSDSVATCVCLQAAMKQRSAQAIVLYAMDLEEHLGLGDFSIETARESFLTDEAWQPTRRYLERLAATPDWGEVIVAANLCLEPILGTLIRRELGTRAAAASGDTVTPVLAAAATQEWEWVRAWSTELCRFLLDDEIHGAANRAQIRAWVEDWMPLALEAALALTPFAARVPPRIDIAGAIGRVRDYAGAMLEEAGLGETAGTISVGSTPGGELPARAARLATTGSSAPTPPSAFTPPTELSVGPTGAGFAPPTGPPPTAPVGAYDYVGIVMAKSAEGDAVADVLRRRDDVEVIEQPAFWEIRAEHRLVIPYDAVSEQLGYEINAYSIQHEMSTHYGRMVATDDALMLFSDPTEAMQYLMS
jgi:propane monooxygenase reductase subunit